MKTSHFYFAQIWNWHGCTFVIFTWLTIAQLFCDWSLWSHYVIHWNHNIFVHGFGLRSMNLMYSNIWMSFSIATIRNRLWFNPKMCDDIIQVVDERNLFAKMQISFSFTYWVFSVGICPIWMCRDAFNFPSTVTFQSAWRLREL